MVVRKLGSLKDGANEFHPKCLCLVDLHKFLNREEVGE